MLAQKCTRSIGLERHSHRSNPSFTLSMRFELEFEQFILPGIPLFSSSRRILNYYSWVSKDFFWSFSREFCRVSSQNFFGTAPRVPGETFFGILLVFYQKKQMLGISLRICSGISTKVSSRIFLTRAPKCYHEISLELSLKFFLNGFSQFLPTFLSGYPQEFFLGFLLEFIQELFMGFLLEPLLGLRVFPCVSSKVPSTFFYSWNLRDFFSKDYPEFIQEL